MVYNKESYERYMLKIKSDPLKHEKYKQKQRELHRERLKNPIEVQKNRDRVKKWNKNKRQIDPYFQQKENKRYRFLHKNNRLECIYYYSKGTMKCNCCGENEWIFLEIDHVNNDGNKHRKELGHDRIESWLIKNNFPEGFQVLCSNCNKGRHLNGGICPHA